MRVLFNLLDAGVGGGQQVALGVAGELAQRGHRLGVVVPSPGPATERFEALGAVTHVASLVSLRRPGLLRGARIARRYDLVYSHTSVPGEILGALAAVLARRPHVVHQHPYPHFSPRRATRVFQRALYRLAVGRARVVAVADHVADAVAETGVPRQRIAVISNGVDIPEEPAPPRTAAGRIRAGLLGRMDPSKGIDVFVRSARHVEGAAELLVGVPELRGTYAERMLTAARAANVAIESPVGPDFLRSLDVVVLPSHHEGRPLVLLEAMALGKAVIATAIPGIREVVEPEHAAVLVPPGDERALAAALRSLAGDPDRRAALGARAREVAASRYALADVHDQIIALLERAVAGRD